MAIDVFTLEFCFTKTIAGDKYGNRFNLFKLPKIRGRVENRSIPWKRLNQQFP